MSFILEDEVVDLGVKKEGVWKENPRWSGVKWRIASSTVGEVKRALTALMEPIQQAGIQLDDEEVADRMSDFVAEHILLDWKGDIKAGNKPLAYNKKNAKMVLMQAEGLRDWIVQQSDNLENFRAKNIKDLEGNSETA